ncbi:MAG: hypothetical protein V4557_00705 [Bacteroidota bacterium]
MKHLSPLRIACYLIGKRALVGLMCLLGAKAAFSTTYYSRASAALNTASTWSTSPTGSPINGTAITNNDVFIIQNGNNVTVGANRTISGLTVDAGGTLTFGIRSLTFLGDCLNNGTMTGTTGQIIINDNLFTNNGSFDYTTGRITMTTGNFINNGTVTGTSGRITETSGNITNSATGSIMYSATAVITLGTGDFINLNSSSSVNFGTAAIVVSGIAASQSIGGFTTNGRFSCTKTSGTATLTGDVTSNGLTMNGAGGTLDLGTGLNHTTNGTVILTAGTLYGGSAILNVNIISTSAWGGSNATVFDPGIGTVNLGANGAQRLSASGTKTFYNLTFSNTGLKTDLTTVVNNIFSIEGSATASAAPTYGPSASLRYNTSSSRSAGVEWITPFVATGGVIIDNTGTITANGSKVFDPGVPFLINPGATFDAAANDITFNGDFINNGIWTSSSGNVIIAGTAAQDIGGFTTSGALSMIKTNGTAILQGDVNAGDLTTNGAGGILRLGGGHTHTFTGTWTNTAGTLRCNTSTLNIDGVISGNAITFTSNNGTVNFRSNSPQAIPDFTYNNVSFSGTGLKTLTGTTTVDEVLTINASSELDLGSFTLNLAGGGTPLVNNGTFSAGTSTVMYSNSNPTTIAAVDYYNLDGSGGDRILATTDSLGIAGSFTIGAGDYTVLNSIVDFNGASTQTIPSFTFHTLIVSNAGTKHIPASTTVTCKSIDVTDDANVEINADGGGKLNVGQ